MIFDQKDKQNMELVPSDEGSMKIQSGGVCFYGEQAQWFLPPPHHVYLCPSSLSYMVFIFST